VSSHEDSMAKILVGFPILLILSKHWQKYKNDMTKELFL
jgi:hypothetical protein